MKIDKLVETPEGSVQFKGELSNEQVQFLIEVGLNVVLSHGAVPFITVAEDKPSVVVPTTDTTH